MKFDTSGPPQINFTFQQNNNTPKRSQKKKKEKRKEKSRAEKSTENLLCMK